MNLFQNLDGGAWAHGESGATIINSDGVPREYIFDLSNDSGASAHVCFPYLGIYISGNAALSPTVSTQLLLGATGGVSEQAVDPNDMSGIPWSTYNYKLGTHYFATAGYRYLLVTFTVPAGSDGGFYIFSPAL